MRREDFKTNDWLEWFIDEEFLQIFKLDDLRRVGTTGHLAVVTLLPGRAENDCPKEKIPKSIANLLATKPVKTESISWIDLTRMAGKCSYTVQELCSGCRCGQCDGNFFDVGPDPRRGLIWGDVINANLIALVAERCPSSKSVTIEKCKNDMPGSMTWFLRIVSPEWTAIVSGMPDNEDEMRHVREGPPELMIDRTAMCPRHA